MLGVMADTKLSKRVISLEEVGPVSVYIQGDLDRCRQQAVFLTVHHVGCDHTSLVSWVSTHHMKEVRDRAVFLHVSLPGQEEGSEELPRDFTFPSMAKLGLSLVTVLDHLRVPRVVGLGEGAGANIVLRFGLYHPNRVHGIFAINLSTSISRGRFMEALKEKFRNQQIGGRSSINENNVSKYVEAFRRRTEITSEELKKRMSFELMLVVGKCSKYVPDNESVCQCVAPALCNFVKVQDVKDPLLEAPGKLAEILRLFSQGLSLLPSVGSIGTSIKIKTGTMKDFDVPNVRRLSVCPN